MCSRWIVVIFLSNVAWAHAKELMTNDSASAQGSVDHMVATNDSASAQGSVDHVVDNWVDGLFERAFRAFPLHRMNLDYTALAKDPSRMLALPMLSQTSEAAPARLLRDSGHLDIRNSEGESPFQNFFSVVDGQIKSAKSVALQWKPSPHSVLGMWQGQSQSHSQRGQQIEPYNRKRPTLDKSKTVQAALKEKEFYRHQEIQGHIARAEGVLDVKASPIVVWKQLFHFPSYEKKCPVASAAIPYNPDGFADSPFYQKAYTEIKKLLFPSESTEQSELSADPDELLHSLLSARFEAKSGKLLRTAKSEEQFFVRFQSTVLPGVKFTANCDLTYEPAKNSVTWQLDPNKKLKPKNSFDEVQGHWHVAPHPDGPSKARVFYEMGLTIPRWIPKALINQLAKFVVRDATWWVKKESEIEAAKR